MSQRLKDAIEVKLSLL
jgi:hypothetical protein